MGDDGKPLHERRLWEFQALRDLCVIAAILGVMWLGARLDAVTAPLLFGLGVAYLCEPAIGWLCARSPRITRVRAVAILISGTVLAGLLFLALVVPPVVRQGVSLARNSEGYLAGARAWATAEQRPAWLRERARSLDGLLERVGLGGEAAKPADPQPAPETAPTAGAALDEARVRQLVREELERARPAAGASAQADLASRVKDAVAAIGAGVAAVVGGVFAVGLFVVIAAFTAVSCMLRWPELLELGRSLIPTRARDRVLPLVARMDATVASFIRGRITVAAIVGVVYAAGWSIVGVPYGLVLGLMVGVFSIVPYLAAVGLPIAWGLLAMSLIAHPETGGWYVAPGADGAPEITWWMVLVLPWLVNLVAQSLEDYVLNPLIQGKATELHPVVIMLAVIAGGSLAGLYGMLLAVPVAACLKILLVAEIMPRLRAWSGS